MVRHVRSRDTRTWDTSWLERVRLVDGGATMGQGRQPNQLLLDLGAETIGFRLLWVGWLDEIERRQPVAQSSAGGKRARPRQPGLAAALQQRGVVPGRP